MNRRLFLVGFIILLSIGVRSQYNIDSLWQVWHDETHSDTDRVFALQDLAWYGYLYSNPDSAFIVAQMAYDFAKEKGIKKHMAIAMNTQATSVYFRGDYSKSLDYFQRCLAIAEELEDYRLMAGYLNNIGSIYQAQGDRTHALDFYIRSLEYSRMTGYDRGVAGNLNNIGNLYQGLNQDSAALYYFKQSWAFSEKLGSKKSLANTSNNLGILYEKKGELDSALESYKLSIQLHEEINDKIGLAEPLNNTGEIYQKFGDYDKALKYYKQSLEMMQEVDYKIGIVKSLLYIGKLHLELKELGLSEKYCNRALKVARDAELINEQKQSCKCLYETHKERGEGMKALSFHEQMLMLEDSLKKDEAANKLHQMEFKNQVIKDSINRALEQKKLEDAYHLELAQEKKKESYLIIGGLFILIMALVIYSRLRLVRNSRTVLQKEKDRSDSLLLNILPQEVATELKEKGKADARDFDLVSIMFSDFKEFTSTAEKMSARALVEEVNECFEAFDSILERYQIEKIKTIGDAYMAAGGLPVPSRILLNVRCLQLLICRSLLKKDTRKEMKMTNRPLGCE